MKGRDIRSVLIIGAAGGLANIVVGFLHRQYPEAQIYGVDNREKPDRSHTRKMNYRRIRYSRNDFEKLFREVSFDAVFHLGRVSHSRFLPKGGPDRYDFNILETGRILDLCLRFSVKKVVLLSTFHVYGACSDNPVFLTEEAPLRASIGHPDLRDVVEMDQIADVWMWKNQKEIEAVLLRPCNIIGSQIQNTMSSYLLSHMAPLPMDFNPTFQFIHESDMARVLVRSLEELPVGVYNVAPTDTVPVRSARKYMGIENSPVFPVILLDPVTRIFSGAWKFPSYLMDYLKFSCVIANDRIREYLGDDFCRYSTRQALENLE